MRALIYTRVATKRATALAPQPLIIALSDGTPLDAGMVTPEGNRYHIAPPAIPMVDQLLAWLDTKPSQYIGIQSRHMGVGMAALCVRWGSYLATLLDADARLHPDLVTGAQTRNMGLIDDDEMRRMNIEVSYAIARLAGIYHERGFEGLVDMLTRAYLYLPMPQKSVQMNRASNRRLIASIAVAKLTSCPPEHADRAIANALAQDGWRNAGIEGIHGGIAPAHQLLPHQRRMRPREAGKLLRDISGNFAYYYFQFDTLFGAEPFPPDTPSSIVSAARQANLHLESLAHGWSLTATSAPVTLPE